MQLAPEEGPRLCSSSPLSTGRRHERDQHQYHNTRVLFPAATTGSCTRLRVSTTRRRTLTPPAAWLCVASVAVPPVYFARTFNSSGIACWFSVSSWSRSPLSSARPFQLSPALVHHSYILVRSPLCVPLLLLVYIKWSTSPGSPPEPFPPHIIVFIQDALQAPRRALF